MTRKESPNSKLSPEMQALLEHLECLPPGPVVDMTALSERLSACWGEFEGSNKGSMAGRKLHDRMEQPMWNPPELTFEIERHGGTVMGSSRAELYQWTVDIERRTAVCAPSSYRQIRPMAKRLDVAPLAKSIAQAIVKREDHQAVKWKQDKTAHVLIGNVLPANSAAAQTLASRRKRFWRALDEFLAEYSYKRVERNKYQRE